jgi:uncharacterized membrane protein
MQPHPALLRRAAVGQVAKEASAWSPPERWAFLAVVSSRPRLFTSILASVLSWFFWPSAWADTSRLILSWDVGAFLYLILAWTMFARSTNADLHSAGGDAPSLRIAIAVGTILCSWFFLHTIFALHYAHVDYDSESRSWSLKFPGDDPPDYWDFVYFSFNLGAAAQTSDVMIMSSTARRVVLAHTILSFLFNTTVLALAVNVGAGLL